MYLLWLSFRRRNLKCVKSGWLLGVAMELKNKRANRAMISAINLNENIPKLASQSASQPMNKNEFWIDNDEKNVWKRLTTLDTKWRQITQWEIQEFQVAHTHTLKTSEIINFNAVAIAIEYSCGCVSVCAAHEWTQIIERLKCKRTRCLLRAHLQNCKTELKQIIWQNWTNEWLREQAGI